MVPVPNPPRRLQNRKKESTGGGEEMQQNPIPGTENNVEQV